MFDPTHYPPPIRELLADRRVMPLGPGVPNHAVHAALRRLTPTSAFAPLPVKHESSARACLAALWLLHDFADESHAISQEIDTAEGSYWHGILHRREPDYANAKYWFRRVGRHPVFEPLQVDAAKLARTAGVADAEFLMTQQAWDAFAFVDLCEAASDGNEALTELCREIQRCEWELLFDECYRRTLG